MRVDGDRAIWMADKDDFWWFWREWSVRGLEGKEREETIPMG